MPWSPLNVFLLLLFGAGVVAGIAGLGWAAVRRRAELASIAALGLAGWTAVYLAVLVAVSLTSDEVELARGQSKHFCGFYVDCHLSLAVEGLSRIQAPGGETPVEGLDLYVVRVRVASDAKRASLTLHRPGIRIIDDGGHFFTPLRTEGDPEPLSHPVEAGSGYSTELYFELPPNLANPRLLVTEMEGVWPDRALEMFLIGDEDSVLHKKTTLQL